MNCSILEGIFWQGGHPGLGGNHLWLGCELVKIYSLWAAKYELWASSISIACGGRGNTLFGQADLFGQAMNRPLRRTLAEPRLLADFAPGGAACAQLGDPRFIPSRSQGFACNTNGRQAVFFLEPGRSRYQAMIIDQGFCFNAGEWNFPDAPLRGLYSRHSVYRHVTGIDSFEPWLNRVEERLSCAQLGEIAGSIPPEWYNDEYVKLDALIRKLDQRRRLVRELIVSARDSGRHPFPNWK